MRSPDRKLLPQEIARKKKKLSKTFKQLEGLTEGTRKHHRKSFKAEKTLDQVTTGKSGIRPNKSALNMLGVSRTEYGESRGEGHDVKQDFRYDPADKKNFQALNQKTKDSLQGEAYKYDKPFFSPKHGVNVDPEDGVLSNRPIYSDNTKLTYDKIDKPFSESGINRKEGRKIPGQDLDRVQVDEKGEYAVNMYNRQDTIRPADGKNFKPFIKGKQSGKMPGGYLSDDDYTIKDGKISGINRNETKTDSLGHDAAWAKWEKGYMDRTHKMKGTKFQKPITPEENRKEMEMERGEFMYDKAKGQIRLRKTDDAERPIERNSKKKNPISFNDPYAGQYEAGAGGGADYFSNAEDFQKLFGSIGDAFSKAYTPENRAKYQEKRADRREKRGKDKHKLNTLELFNVKNQQGQPIGENKDRVAFEKKTQDIRDKAAKNKAKALLSKKKKDQNT